MDEVSKKSIVGLRKSYILFENGRIVFVYKMTRWIVSKNHKDPQQDFNRNFSQAMSAVYYYEHSLFPNLTRE